MAAKKSIKKEREDKKTSYKSSKAIAHVKNSCNNMIITITDLNGNTICWSSAGSLGFKGACKGTAFAMHQVATQAACRARECGVKKIDMVIRGPGSGHESAIRAFQCSELEVKSIKVYLE